MAGLFLILAFFGLSMTAPGLRITFRPPLTASSPGEVYFWLGHALLLFPASCLIGHALAGWIGPRLVRLRTEIGQLASRDLAVGALAFFLVTVALARVGRFLVFYDFPFTDDEYATQFGGYIFATGRAAAKLILPTNAIPTLGLYYRTASSREPIGRAPRRSGRWASSSSSVHSSGRCWPRSRWARSHC
jgi:hypothetical protein